MTRFGRRKRCGFTLVEFAVVAALLGIFVTILAGRMLSYYAEAERVAAEQLVGTLRTALQVRAARAVIERGDAGLAPIADENPFTWLRERPENYLGEYYRPDLDQLPAGQWLFDRSDKTLLYIFSDIKSFSPKTSNFLKFKVKLIRLPNLAGRDGLSRSTKGLVLDQVSDRVAVNN